MQAEHFSDSLDGSSNPSGVHDPQPTHVCFQLTPEDIEIMEQHLEGFGEADTKACTKLVQTIMGELY